MAPGLIVEPMIDLAQHVEREPVQMPDADLEVTCHQYWIHLAETAGFRYDGYRQLRYK